MLTGCLVHRYGIWVSEEMRFVLGKGTADENANVLSDNGVLWNAGIFECFKGAFEKKTLLGIHGNGLLFSQTKKRGIEGSQVDIQEVAADGIQGAAFALVGMVEAGTVESLLGDFGPAGPGPSAEFPKLGRSRDIAGHPTGHSNNGYRHILKMAGGRERGTRAGPRVGSPAAMAIGVDTEAVRRGTIAIAMTIPYGGRVGVFAMVMAVVADAVMAVTITHVKVAV